VLQFRHRPGSSRAPASHAAGINQFTLGSWAFLRLLAIVHLIAFVSFWVQLEGLVGPNGILPATRYFNAVRAQLGPRAFSQLPSLCWWFGTETFLHVLCGVGVVAALALVAGFAPPLCLFVLWAAYLSLNTAGQVFFNFQWDALLLETTLLAIFVAPWTVLPWWRIHKPPAVARWLLWWLLFRLMFFAGVVKLASGDPTWRDLTALTFHYETQPLPTPLAWYSHQLPAWWHRASCAGMFVIELLVPFFLFGPRTLRHNAALLLTGLMASVALTGNYTFFNLLAIALCLTCFDDAWWLTVLGWTRRVNVSAAADAMSPASTGQGLALAGFAVFVFVHTSVQELTAHLGKVPPPPGFGAVARAIAPYRSLNNYGLFAVMTNPRPELIFQGSEDGRTWQAYGFPHKPGALVQRPTWVAPHQPRLDWQLWFAALGSPQQDPWVYSLCEHLLRGTPEVLALLASNPFEEHPPQYVRVVRYEYHFTDAATRAHTGEWWRRTPLDVYIAPASLR
jgi:lipase maturation factor 1